jgi:polyhydroxybutyrate depolymerase
VNRAVAGLLASAFVLAACQAGSRPVAAPRPTSTSSVASTTTSLVCPSPGGGETVETIALGAATRSYRLTRPLGPGRHPLILLFHGSGSTAAIMAAYTGLPARAAAQGYVVVTPDAVNHNWQVSQPSAHTADLAFVAALVASVEGRFCIDPDRVYAAGFSLGSEFAAIVGCAPTPPIAAIGLASAEFLLRPCARPVPVIAFHGTADPAVPYQDGAIGLSLPGIKVRGVEKNLGDWAALDGCSPAPAVAAVFPNVIRRTWPACGAGTGVVLYTVVQGGHAWPGLPLDATGRILAFFAAHPASAAPPK